MKLKLSAILLLFFGLTFATKAEDPDKIVTKMMETRGGIDKIQNINSIYFEMEQSGPQMPVPSILKIWHVKPDKIKLEQNMNNETVTVASDGQKAWIINPKQGSTEPQEMPIQQAAGLVQYVQLLEGELLNYKEKGLKLEYVEMVDDESGSFHKIKATDANGNSSFVYVDPITNLINRTEAKQQTQQGEANIVTKITERTKVNGIMFPKSIDIEMNGQVVQSLTFNKIELDGKIDNTIFAMPTK